MTMTTAAITATDVHYSYGDTVVLDGIDLSVEPGTIFALLGPNGAGKTTMVRILATLIGAQRGRLTVLGHDVATQADAVRGVIGVTGQFSAVDDLLTGRENLRLMADLHHLPRAERPLRVDALLQRFDLDAAADRPASTYSGGMRRRLDLAMTLVGAPRVIFLDEPTTGLDPRSRRTMWDGIRALAREGVTIFLTTQYLDEADELADRIAVLDHGQLVAEGTPAELKRRIPGGHIELQFADQRRLESAVALLGASSHDDDALTVDVDVDGGAIVERLRAVLNQLDGAGLGVEHLALHTADLDDVFFAVTGHPTTEQQETIAS